MQIKKRYLISLSLLISLYGITQFNFCAFRESPENQIIAIKANTKITPIVDHYEIGKQRIQYTHIGDTSLPLVILVHGSPGSSSAYMSYMQDSQLLAKAQLVAVDRPGFGYSNLGKTQRSLEMQAKAFLPILKKYNTSKTILVGHSFGGPVISRMAMDFPDLIDGLVIVAGSIDPDLEPNEWWRKPLNWRILRWLLPKALRVCNQEILPLEGELRKMLPLWEKITIPVTVIQGEKDNLVPKGNAEFAKKMLVNSEQVKLEMIPDGNHFILWSLRDKVVKEIIELL